MPLYPFLVLEVESGLQVPTFRNSTYSDPQVGLTKDLGARHPSPHFGSVSVILTLLQSGIATCEQGKGLEGCGPRGRLGSHFTCS
jgi:hypothetical protein